MWGTVSWLDCLCQSDDLECALRLCRTPSTRNFLIDEPYRCDVSPCTCTTEASFLPRGGYSAKSVSWTFVSNLVKGFEFGAQVCHPISDLSGFTTARATIQMRQWFGFSTMNFSRQPLHRSLKMQILSDHWSLRNLQASKYEKYVDNHQRFILRRMAMLNNLPIEHLDVVNALTEVNWDSTSLCTLFSLCGVQERRCSDQNTGERSSGSSAIQFSVIGLISIDDQIPSRANRVSRKQNVVWRKMIESSID